MSAERLCSTGPAGTGSAEAFRSTACSSGSLTGSTDVSSTPVVFAFSLLLLRVEAFPLLPFLRFRYSLTDTMSYTVSE